MKTQQEALEGLKALGEHLEEWGRTEGELKGVVGRLGEMDGRAGEQMGIGSDPSIQPPVLESSLDSDLRTLRKSLVVLESSHQSSLLSDRLNLKVPFTQTLEVTGKETVVDLVRTAIAGLKTAKEEMMTVEQEMRSGYVENSKEGQTAVNSLKDRFEAHRESLENEIIAGLLQTQGRGKVLLEREVLRIVDQEVGSLRAHLTFQSSQMDLLLKQELLALRLQLDGVKALTVPVHLAEEPEEQQVQTAYSAATQAVTTLADLPATIADLGQVMDLLEAEVREVTAELEGKPRDVSEKLEAALFQLEMLQRSVRQVGERTEAEPERLRQGAQALETAYSQLGRDNSELTALQTRVASLSLAAPLAQLQERLSSLSLSLHQVWTTAVKNGQAPALPEAAVWGLESVQS